MIFITHSSQTTHHPKQPEFARVVIRFPNTVISSGVRDLENRFQMIPMEMYHAAIITKCYESCKLLRLMVGKQCLWNLFPSFSDNTQYSTSLQYQNPTPKCLDCPNLFWICIVLFYVEYALAFKKCMPIVIPE